MKSILVSVLVLLFATNFAFARAIQISEIRCEQKIAPIGITATQPRFSWKINSDSRGFKQSAYRIMVADSRKMLESGGANCWDSKKQRSDQSILIPYSGRDLKSGTRYYWKAMIWGGNGGQSQWSYTGEFTTGLFDPAEWGNAQWIGLENDSIWPRIVPGIHQPLVQSELGDKQTGMFKLPILRKEFSTAKKVESALVFVTGLGHFDLFLNGSKVGENFMDPGWTKYDKSALYVTFDVTQDIKAQNAIGIMLGNGFYNIPRDRYYKQLSTFGAPKTKLKLEIRYTDGTSEIVVSDNSWKASSGPITYSSIYAGEDYDARLAQKEWCVAHFDDSQWSPPVISDLNIELRSQQSEPLKVRDEFQLVKRFKNGAGNWVYDFGQNFSGIVRLKVRGEGGASVILRPGELLNPNQTVNQSASGAPFYFKYTLNGEGDEMWTPQFTYYGFRYIEVEGGVPYGETGEEGKPRVVELTGLHTTSSAEEVGKFICSKQMFNDIYQLIDWSIRSNLASVLTDCPHREKLGWLEVAHLMQYSMQYRYDLSAFYGKIMGDMSDSQTEEGLIPSISPEYVRFSAGFENSPEWGSAQIITPWYLYLWYSDKQLIKEYYPQMKRYLAYLSSRADNHILEYGLGDWFDLGPDTPGYSQLTSKGVTATGVYYYNATIMSKVAQLLGLEKDKADFDSLTDQIKQAFNAKYFDPVTCQYDRNSQTASAIALYYGLVPEGQKGAVYQNLLDDIKARNYALTAGDIGYRYLLCALSDGGYDEVIAKMNSKYDTPGYGWQLAHGATSLTESWQAYGFVSNNHCMLGHLMEWLFCGLGGIKQTQESVGFKQLLIEPKIVYGLTFASTNYESPYGRVESRWSLRNGQVELHTVIPANCSAWVMLDCPAADKIFESGTTIKNSTFCKVVKQTSTQTIVEVGSGNYSFKYTQPSGIQMVD